MIGNRTLRPTLWLRLALATGLLLGAWIAPASEPSSEPAAPTRFEVEALRADFDALYEGLQAAHYDLFARRDREAYDALHARMRAGIDAPMTLAEAEVYFQRFVAHGDIAHANIAFPAAAWEAYRRGGGKALPVYPRFDGRHFHVADSYVEGLPAGARVTSLDGEPIDAWFRRLRAHLSADSDAMARAMLEFRWPALLWLEAGEREHHELGWIDADGKARTTRIATLDLDALRAAAARSATPDRADRAVEIRKDGIAYLRPGPFYNTDPGATDPWDPSSFIAFIDEAFAEILVADARALLIDLRDNPGGNSSFSDPMVAWFADRPFRFASSFRVKSSDAARTANRERLRLAGDRPDPVSRRYEAEYAQHPPGTVFELDFPAALPREGRRFEGPVYLLVNRHSYSNTVTVAALAQDLGFARILGEETTDLATTYGAMEHFTLPRTGIQVSFPKARIVRPSGATADRGVVPDVAIRTPVRGDAWQVVLDRAVEIIDGELRASTAAKE